MGLEVLIIPLIALAVWIFQYIFKVPEDQKNQPAERARTRPRPRPTPAERPRRPATDLDRYLEESRRRRGDEPEPVVVELAPEERPRRPAPPPQRPPRPERRPEPVRRSPTPAPALREAPVIITPTTVAPLDQAAPEMQVLSVAGLREAQAPMPRLPQSSRLLGALLPVLRSGQGAALAVLMNEIMQPPKALRNR